jgi:uncharacterized protein (DUF2062 family)
MLFKHRIKPNWVDRIRQLLWPDMTFRRVLKYYKQRVARLPGTPHSIAAGFAAGAAVSFTPFMGFHFLLGAIVAYFLRGNLVASALGTLVGNPWTFPFIWLIIYELGVTILPQKEQAISFESLSFAYLSDHIGDVLVPMILGGMILSLIVWPLFYFPLVRMIEKFRKARLERRRRKWAKAKRMAEAGEAA